MINSGSKFKELHKYKLLFIEESPVYYDGNKYSILNPSVVHFFGKFIDYFKEIVIAAPMKKVDSKHMKGNAEDCFKFCPLPFSDSIIDFMKKFPINFYSNFKRLKFAVKHSDIIIIRLPALLVIFVYFFARYYKKPTFGFITVDVKQAVMSGEKYHGMQKMAAILAANLSELLYMQFSKSFPVFATKGPLYEKYRNITQHCHEYVANQISEQDIFTREDTCQEETINLLFIGGLDRFVPLKGLHYLFEAVAKLKERGQNVNLRIVGPPEEYIKGQVVSLQITDMVEYLGYVPFGRDLFDIYKKTDVLVFPSLSEGQPKVPLDAMAFGVPIVATNVGGIPELIGDNERGLLVPPKSSDLLAEAIEKLIISPNLRRKLIKNGYNFVKENSREKCIERILEVIQYYLSKQKK